MLKESNYEAQREQKEEIKLKWGSKWALSYLKWGYLYPKNEASLINFLHILILYYIYNFIDYKNSIMKKTFP